MNVAIHSKDILHSLSQLYCLDPLLTEGNAAENGDPIPSEADEELFHSLLAKAGMHLANAEGDESLVHLDAEALQVSCSTAQRITHTVFWSAINIGTLLCRAPSTCTYHCGFLYSAPHVLQ